MVEKPVFILGAGATSACGGPLTNEILPAAINGHMAHDDRQTAVEDREELLGLARAFLNDCFNVPLGGTVTKDQCPSLPMVLSMLRRSEEMNKPLGAWAGERLVKARRAIEYALFAVIEATLQRIPAEHRYHLEMLEPLYRRGVEPTVVSLNYDVIVDNAMFSLSDGCPPDYGVDIATPAYAGIRQRGTFGRLLKIHGSLNWLYCEECQRLDLFVSEGLRGLRTSKALDDLYHSTPFNDAYSCRGTPCRNAGCGGFVSPILITPTYVKDYENPHVARVWAAAEEAMKASDRAVFIGYSLPTDDVEVALLFKRGLDHLPRNRITVVEYVHDDVEHGRRTEMKDHPTGQRFRSLFGEGLDFQTHGFAGWLSHQKPHGFPFTR